MPTALRLTVSDQSPVHPLPVGTHIQNAAMLSIELAKNCDALGHDRTLRGHPLDFSMTPTSFSKLRGIVNLGSFRFVSRSI